MSVLVFWGAIFFTLALVFYSIGVWKGRQRQQLKYWHLLMFGLGVFTDSIGTLFMYLHVGHLVFTAHSIAGFLGLALMFFHSVWAWWVFNNRNIKLRGSFQRFSIAVWLFWLLSYFSGLYLGIERL